ncbi:MAG: fasciclin domain-containing protein [Longimonas sp.]|uniref:fasciclin domain-containing protein n=1 Tax=Longimonas sp. TaxID=2039626 RepID=UPI0039752152
MLRFKPLVWTVMAVLFLGLVACDDDNPVSDDPDPDPDPDPMQTIGDIVGEDDNFSTLLTALEEAELAGALTDEEATFTVFAPNNDAFEAINTEVLLGQGDALEEVLEYHVVPDQALAASELEDGENTVETLSGDELTIEVTDDGVFIEGSEVIQTDVEAANGIIHVLDRPLLGNQNLANTAWFVNETEELYNAVVGAELDEAFVGAEGWTVFGPNNDTFENADLSGFSDEEVQQILEYHVYNESVVDSGELLSLLEDNDGEVNIETRQGENLTIAQDGDQIVFNGGQATLDTDNLDYTASNGILHVIDGLLLPPSIAEANADAISYDLAAQSNDGAIADGVEGTATFWRLSDTQTLVTLELTDGATGADVSHPAHIHQNSAEDGGDIEYYLTPIDGTDEGASSARVIDVPFDDLTDFNGYINIHESVDNLGTVVSQGNIGANASGSVEDGLDFVESPRTTDYDLDANANDGSVAPDGVPATATFRELNDDLTLVTLNMNIDGATGASVSHPAHIHNGNATEGGGIEYYLSPIDGGDEASRSSKIVDASYDTLTGFDGYINIHESVANLGEIVSQGNIGSNADDDDSGNADVTVTIDNNGSSSWSVTNVDGESGVAGSGDNPDLNLTVGTRYRFVNNGGSNHPLGFQNGSAEYLLNQDGDGSLEEDDSINYEEDDDGVTFTYTQDLADAVATYRCTVHGSMESSVQTNN